MLQSNIVLLFFELFVYSSNTSRVSSGNIPNGDGSAGEVISQYIPPCPAKGTGYHRFVFCLLNQTTRCDFEELHATYNARFETTSLRHRLVLLIVYPIQKLSGQLDIVKLHHGRRGNFGRGSNI